MNPRYVGEISGRIKAVAEIVDLPYEAITSFYQQNEEENAAEITATEV